MPGQQSSIDPQNSSLLDGSYDEDDNAEEFQKALKDWRRGPTSQDEVKESGIKTHCHKANRLRLNNPNRQPSARR
jgi:hypothetical protein